MRSLFFLVNINMLIKTDITHDANEILELVKHLGPGKNSINVPTGRFFYDSWETISEFKNTSIDTLLQKIPNIGEARINVLQPGESYMAHADIDDRYHLTLDGEYSFLIDLKDNIMHDLPKDNILYRMDTSRVHTASNYGFKNRLQLVIRILLNETKLKDPVKILINATETPYNLRYLFDNSFSIMLNVLNKKEQISNFTKISEKSIEFEIERSGLDKIEKCRKQCGFNTEVQYL